MGGDGSSARVVVPQYSYPSFGGTMSVVEEYYTATDKGIEGFEKWEWLSEDGKRKCKGRDKITGKGRDKMMGPSPCIPPSLPCKRNTPLSRPLPVPVPPRGKLKCKGCVQITCKRSRPLCLRLRVTARVR